MLQTNIKSVEVQNLFGTLNTKISLEDDLTFIHGKNGQGKTTLFRLIKALLEIDEVTLFSTRFSSLTLNFNNHNKLLAEYGVSQAHETNMDQDLDQISMSEKLTISLLAGDKCEKKLNIMSHTDEVVSHDEIQELSDESFWSSSYTPSMYLKKTAYTALRQLYPDLKFKINIEDHTATSVDSGETRKIWEWLQLNEKQQFRNLIKEQFRSCLLFESNRLFRSGIETLIAFQVDEEEEEREARAYRRQFRHRHRYSNIELRQQKLSVDELSKHAQRLIASIETQIGQNAANLDQKFIADLFKLNPADVNDDLVLSEIARFYECLSDSERFFPSNIELHMTDDIPEHAVPFLNILFTSLQDRYSDRFKFAEKAKVFEELMGERITNKKVTITPSGIKVIGHGGEELPLSRLSSGEQHQLVSLYGLIFLGDDHAFILFDEPEISLHPDWQEIFAATILKICKMRGHQFLIATHSPDIIGEEIYKVRPMISSHS